MRLTDFFNGRDKLSPEQRDRLTAILTKAGLLTADGQRLRRDDDDPVQLCFRECNMMVSDALDQCDDCEDDDCYEECADAAIAMAEKCFMHCEQMAEDI